MYRRQLTGDDEGDPRIKPEKPRANEGLLAGEPWVLYMTTLSVVMTTYQLDQRGGGGRSPSLNQFLCWCSVLASLAIIAAPNPLDIL